MKHTCEYMPVTFGTYQEPAPEPVVCGMPAQVRLRVTFYKDRYRQPEKPVEIAQVVEAWHCWDCFAEILALNGNYTGFEDPEGEDLSEFDPEDGGDFNPDFGPKLEILEKL